MHRDCERDAKFQLGWVAYTHGLDPSKKLRVSGYLAVGVCDEHVRITKNVDVMNAETLTDINGRLVAAGKLPITINDVRVAHAEIIGDRFRMPSDRSTRH